MKSPLRFQKQKHFLSLVAALAIAPVLMGASPSDPAQALAEKLLSTLTLEEKIALCHGNGTMTIAANPKIGLNEEFWFSDGSNNVRHELERDTFLMARGADDTSTSLPTLSALAATWDPSLALQYGQVLGEEARARGKDVLLGPGVNLMRTPLCGRNFEYMGEDPFLTSRMAVGYIQGLQSKDVAACVKHFVVNNQELNRFNVDTVVDERTLRELYLPAFEAAIQEAGCLTIMPAYNKFRGEFCCENNDLLNGILKDEWGFKGFAVSDWGGLHDTEKGALGGLDVEMNMGRAIQYFKAPLLEAVHAGKVPESVINDKVKRILYVMAKLKKIGGGERVSGSRNTPAHQTFAREVAEQAIVLLKNDQGTLPLDRGALKTLLVVGNNATEKHATHGGSSVGKPPYEISPLEGLQKLLGDHVKIDYIPSRFTDKFESIPDNCIETVDSQNSQSGLAVKAWKAEYFDNPDLQGEPKMTGFDPNIHFAWKNQRPRDAVGPDHFSVRWTATIKPSETGEHIFQVSHDGRARVLVDGATVLDSLTPASTRPTTGQSVPLEKDKSYEVTVEYTHLTGDGEAVLTWRSPSSQVIGATELASRAKAADAVLFFTGNRHAKGQAGESEGADRPDMKLPEGDDAAIATVLAANPHTVVINLSGTPVEMPWVEQAHTLVHYWYSGMEGGNALARVLFGEVNPTGKLPFTFPRQLADSPAHALGNYNAQKVDYAEGLLIGYRWYDTKHIKPLFPFGHGLSYTQFEYSGLQLVKDLAAKGTVVTVQFDITNTGKREGSEVAQLYLHQNQPGVIRPEKELKGFQKITLRPGEKKTVRITLDSKAFAYYDAPSKEWVSEKGAYKVLIGSSSRDIRLESPFLLPKTKRAGAVKGGVSFGSM
jgi:beta-glucosidase